VIESEGRNQKGLLRQRKKEEIERDALRALLLLRSSRLLGRCLGSGLGCNGERRGERDDRVGRYPQIALPAVAFFGAEVFLAGAAAFLDAAAFLATAVAAALGAAACQV